MVIWLTDSQICCGRSLSGRCPIYLICHLTTWSHCQNTCCLFVWQMIYLYCDEIREWNYWLERGKIPPFVFYSLLFLSVLLFRVHLNHKTLKPKHFRPSTFFLLSLLIVFQVGFNCTNMLDHQHNCQTLKYPYKDFHIHKNVPREWKEEFCCSQ